MWINISLARLFVKLSLDGRRKSCGGRQFECQWYAPDSVKVDR